MKAHIIVTSCLLAIHCAISHAQHARQAADFAERSQQLKAEHIKKAEAGDPFAQYLRGMDYLDSDPAMAVAWLEKSAAQDCTWALNQLGICHRDGIGVAKDINKAIALFERASKFGDDELRSAPCFNLGLLYLETDLSQYDPVKGLSWLTKASELKNERASYELGAIYFAGKHVARDNLAGARWTKVAAEQGHTMAQYIIGRFYHLGHFVEKNPAAAFQWLSKAGAKGNTDAQFLLGCLYETGDGVAKDSTEAAKWHLRAAQQGHIDAMNNIGAALYNGTGVGRDPVAAVSWFRKTAEAGDDLGMYNLGLCYLQGAGVPKDEIEAYGYINLAGASLENARKAIQTLELTITPEIRARGQQRSKEIQRQIDEAKMREAALPELLKARPLDQDDKGA